MLDAGMNQEQAQALEQAQAKKVSAADWLKRIAIIVVVIAALIGIGYGLKGLLKGGEVKKQGPTKIQLKDLPPPPPPPPPPKEQPKEQPKDQPKEAPKEPEPKPADAPPPTDTIKMDGPAGDGPSQFGAGAVTNENKSGETGVPTIGGNRPSQASISYANKTFNRLQEAINSEKDLANLQYRVVVYVWVEKDGSISKVELKRSSGNVETDKLLRNTLETIKSMNSAPPPDLPNPIKVEMTSKNST